MKISLSACLTTCLAMLIVLASAATCRAEGAAPGGMACCAGGAASAEAGIRVVVTNFRNDDGQLGCTIFNAPDGFPRDNSKALKREWTKIQGGRAECFFKGFPAGLYALTIFHDENANGKFDMNFVGYPKEGYGFSNNAKAQFSAPSFAETSFPYDGKGVKQIDIQMIYR